jgi:hypothetical protein
MSTSTGSKTSGISLSSLLGTLFITLKLCGIITWSWWWVLAPFWIPLAIVIFIILVILTLKALLT